MTGAEASGTGDAPLPYMIFLVVFLFFLTGLLGFLICHLLKKKGYRCRTGEIDDEEEEEKLGDEHEDNQDTVEQILKCIIENEANMEAFNEMLGNHNICVLHDPRLRKESIGGIPSHHHTVHSGVDHNSCHICAQVRSKKGRRQSRTLRFKQRPGEQTVLSVGRFRVTHTDKKPHGGPNPSVGSGSQLDQSQDSEDRKEAGYNLRSMFKDTRPPSESSSGAVQSGGKRRKSMTIFGLRRGSDPAGIKIREGTGVQQQPVVFEEPLHLNKIKATHESGTKLSSKLITETTKQQTPASPQLEEKTSGSVNLATSQTEKQACESTSVPEDGSKHRPSPDPPSSLNIKSSDGPAVPSHLTIPSPTSSRKIFIKTGKGQDVKNKKLDTEEAYDPGPLQTSTPISLEPVSIPGLIPTTFPRQPENYSSQGLPVTQTPPDPSSSPELEPGCGTSLALISLGSSPQTSFAIKTPSSVSSLKISTSPLVITPSPKLSSRNITSDAEKTAYSPTLTASPKLLAAHAVSSQSPTPSSALEKSTSPIEAQAHISSPAFTVSPNLDIMPETLPQTPCFSPVDEIPLSGRPSGLNVKSGIATSFTSITNNVSSPLSLKEQKEELSPIVGDITGHTISSYSDQLSKDMLSSLLQSPPSAVSPSSPTGGRIISVTTVKPSPESKREFSVVTMLDKDQQSTSQKSLTGETDNYVVESGKAGTSLQSQGGHDSISDVGQAARQNEETFEVEVGSMVSQEKDDMVEKEDIRDITQVEEVARVEEDLERTVHTQD